MTAWEFDASYLAEVESTFPRLKAEGYRPTSPPDDYYNCIAWAAGDHDRWWSPWPEGHGGGGYDSPYGDYWPSGAPRENTLSAWMAALAGLGFVECDTPSLEEGLEKVAIYVDEQNVPQHVALQLPSGYWTSKLGRDLDIEHQTLGGLEGASYGRALRFMMRRSE